MGRGPHDVGHDLFEPRLLLHAVDVDGPGRVIFCAPGSGPTLQQCHKTSRIFAENERILRVATEVASFFIGLFSKEKDLWLFGRAPSASQKALPKSQKGPFSRKRTIKMMPPPTLGKSARSRECP